MLKPLAVHVGVPSAPSTGPAVPSVVMVRSVTTSTRVVLPWSVRVAVMVAAAERRFANEPRVTVRHADATALPFTEGSFDVVVSHLMLHHVIQWRQALEEVSRVLRPGGRFVGYDLVATPLTKGLHWADRSPHQLIFRHQLRPALSQTGLQAAEVRTAVGRQAMRFTATKPY